MLNSLIGCKAGGFPLFSPNLLQPQAVGIRLGGCMSGLAGTLFLPAAGARALPAAGTRVQAKTRVDHRNSEEAALVRRVQARDEMAFREVVERYQAKVFSNPLIFLHPKCRSPKPYPVSRSFAMVRKRLCSVVLSVCSLNCFFVVIRHLSL